jgi:holo-[acyl-carrier protein] synthase
LTAAPGVGIDLVEVDRLARALERRPRLAERLFTADELSHARARRRPARHLAARFAAKEAAIKALGGLSVAPRDIEVAGGDREPPQLRLHGRAAEVASERGFRLEVSLTHTDASAAAVVLARFPAEC